MEVELFPASSLDTDNKWANSARLINWMREPVGDGKFVLRSMLAQSLYGAVPGVFANAAEVVNGTPYIAHGGRVYSMSEGGMTQALGDIQNVSETSMAGNNGRVSIAAGGKYYVCNGTATEEISGGAFDNTGSVVFFNSRTFRTEEGGRRVDWSDPLDPNSFSGAFATSESRDDNNLRAVTAGNALWIMKEKSIEPWYAVGANDFAAIPGATIELGLKAYTLVADMPNGVFFIGSDNKAYIGAGDGIKPVSTIAVNTSLAEEKPRRCFYFEDEGYAFLVVTFRDRPAWCYNIGTGEWTERGDGMGAWQAKVAFSAYGGFFVVNDQGDIYELVRSGLDRGEPYQRRAVSRTFDFGGKPRRVANIAIRASMGTHDKDNTAPRVNSLAEFRTSRDWGHNFSYPMQRSLGAIGQRETEINLRSLGQFEQVTLQLDYSENADATFSTSAFADVV